MPDQYPRSERADQERRWRSIVGIEDRGPENSEDERGSVYSEDEHQSAHSEYEEGQDHYPSYGGDTSVSGPVPKRPQWSEVVGISIPEVKHQPAYPADPSMYYPRGSFQGPSSTSFEGASRQPPYHLGVPVNDTSRARNQPTHPANTRMSYPVSPYFRHGLHDIGSVNRQRSAAFGAGTNPGYGGAPQEEYPSSNSVYYGNTSRNGRDFISANNSHVQTPSSSDLAANSIYRTGNADTQRHPGIIPRFRVEPQSDYHDYYSQPPPGDQDFEDHQPHPPNTLRPQPQVRSTSGTRWSTKESTKALQMYKEERPWAEISKETGRSVEACKGHQKLANQRNKARSMAIEHANVPAVRKIGPQCIDWSDQELIDWARRRVRTFQIEQSMNFQSACREAARELNLVHTLRIPASTVEWCVKEDPTSDNEVIQYTGRGSE